MSGFGSVRSTGARGFVVQLPENCSGSPGFESQPYEIYLSEPFETADRSR